MPSSVLTPYIILEENCEEMRILVLFLKLRSEIVPSLQGDKRSNKAVALDLEVVLLLPPTY